MAESEAKGAESAGPDAEMETSGASGEAMSEIKAQGAAHAGESGVEGGAAAQGEGPPACETGASTGSASGTGSGAAPPLSKNAQKRLVRQAHRHQKKLEKRAAQKARKKADRAERLAAGDSDQPQEKRQKVDKPPRIGGRGSHNRERFDVARKQGKRVCIDLSFDDMMTEKEVKSLVIQLGHAYGTNRKSTRPLDLYMTSLEKRAAAGLGKISGFENWRCECKAEHYSEVFPKENLVYLTSESPNTLQELSGEEVYVIGGIVDHNRLKGLTHGKAQELGLRTARLPLDGNVDLGENRKVLTVNHVFTILLRFHEAGGEEGSWGEALKSSLPARKLRSCPSHPHSAYARADTHTHTYTWHQGPHYGVEV